MWLTLDYPENCIPIYSENTIRYTIASDNEPIIAWWFEISSLASGTARKWQMNPWKIDVGIQPDPKFRISPFIVASNTIFIPIGATTKQIMGDPLPMWKHRNGGGIGWTSIHPLVVKHGNVKSPI